MSPQKSKKYHQKTVKNAIYKRNQLKGYKASITKDYNQGKISSAERQLPMKRLDDARGVLNQYIKHYETRIKTMTGSGVRKQKGGNVVFFNDPKQLLENLELTIGEMMAGNTSIEMRNTGHAILDTLLRMSMINKNQYKKIVNNYFKIQCNYNI